MFQAKVVAHSIGEESGKEIATVVATYPRFIHSELLTHRDRARNSASSRAIPWKRFKKDRESFKGIIEEEFRCRVTKINEFVGDLVDNCMMKMIMTNPVIPLSFDAEQKGMQSGSGDGIDQELARNIWLDARNDAVKHANRLANMGIHKSLVNRIVEPWMWITVIITATEWKNFFRLRCHPAAEKHFQKIAGMIKEELRKSVPRKLKVGEWHLPYFDSKDGIEIAKRELQYVDPRIAQKISTGRCARVSYLTHEGKRDISEDIRLAEQLINPVNSNGSPNDDVMHASPLEHPCECLADGNERSGPFRGWKQFRKEFSRENVEGFQ